MFWLDRVNGNLKVRQPAALCLSTQARHCPSQVQCVESGLSAKLYSSIRNVGGQTIPEPVMGGHTYSVVGL